MKISWNIKIEEEKAEFMMKFGFRPNVLILGEQDYELLKETVRVYQGIMPTRTTEEVGEQFAGMKIAKVELDNFIGFGVQWTDLKK